ncbi:hypothetical protein EON73_05060, partial [bacterium]
DKIEEIAEGQSNVCIFTDSMAALQSLRMTKINSKILLNCLDAVEKVARTKNVKLIWIPAHSNFYGNCMADSIAKNSITVGFEGPEPFIPLSYGFVRQKINEWLVKKIEEEWRFSTTGATTKLFLNKPDTKLKNEITNLKKPQTRTLIGILTGHCNVNSYLGRIGRRDDTDCDHCGLAEDTAQHFLCECIAFKEIRAIFLGSEKIEYNSVSKLNLQKILEYINASNRHLM